MNKKRFKNIDCCKAVALLLVIAYHYWVLSGSAPIPVRGIDTIVKLGGEIGVTMFFILSGFGIYCLLKNKNEVKWGSFIKSRFVKIAPLYYLSILLVLGLTTSGARLLAKNGLADAATHILFIHNFWVRFHGSINGALWTMGVIFQFYCVAVLLYKCMQKNKNATVVASIVFTIGMKFLFYRHILPVCKLDSACYFIYGRELFTALDNFVLGMYAACLICENKRTMSSVKGAICLAALLFCLILWGRWGLTYGVYTDNVRGWLWHSVLALALSGIIFVAGLLKETKYTALLQSVGKNEYGIYLLHLPVLRNLLQAPLIQQLNGGGHHLAGFAVYLIVALMIGYVFNYSGAVIQRKIQK